MSATSCGCARTGGQQCPQHGRDAGVPPAGSSPETAQRIQQLARGVRPAAGGAR